MRKTKEITIDNERSRDNGKTFLITEMDSVKAEKWAMRVLFAMNKTAVIMPDMENAGVAELIRLGVQSALSMNFADAEPLLDEMWECVQIVEPAVTRKPTKSDIEEFATRFMLRKEIILLHIGFFSDAAS